MVWKTVRNDDFKRIFEVQMVTYRGECLNVFKISRIKVQELKGLKRAMHFTSETFELNSKDCILATEINFVGRIIEKTILDLIRNKGVRVK